MYHTLFIFSIICSNIIETLVASLASLCLQETTKYVVRYPSIEGNPHLLQLPLPVTESAELLGSPRGAFLRRQEQAVHVCPELHETVSRVIMLFLL